MRIFCFLALFMSHTATIATEFQLPGYALGSAKATLATEATEQNKVTLFQSEAKLTAVWTAEQLTALQLEFYQGADYSKLKEKTCLLLEQLNKEFGAVRWISADTEPVTDQNLQQQVQLLDEVMAKAAELSAEYNSSHLAQALLVLDFQPEPQPDNSRLHLQVAYSSATALYSLVLFIDQKTAPARTAPAVVNLEAL
jgi:hypothetical protein